MRGAAGFSWALPPLAQMDFPSSRHQQKIVESLGVAPRLSGFLDCVLAWSATRRHTISQSAVHATPRTSGGDLP